MLNSLIWKHVFTCTRVSKWWPQLTKDFLHLAWQSALRDHIPSAYNAFLMDAKHKQTTARYVPGEKMSETPITITQLDLERLERLMGTESVRALPGITMLRDELNRAHVVEPEEIGPDYVTMNSTVQFADDITSSEFQLTLVYPEQGAQPGTVSVFAPVGSALLGLRVGQSIGWQVPGGRQLRLRVVNVVNQPEALREYHR